MTSHSPDQSLDELTGKALAIEDLVSRAALGEMVENFYALFKVPLKVYNEQGRLLADVAEQPELYSYLGKMKYARSQLNDMISEVKALDPGGQGEVTYQSFTGAAYRVVRVSYDGRSIGRMILGPFLPPAVTELPASLLSADPEIDPVAAKALLESIPRAREETVTQIARHLACTLDLILFSGHRALLTSNMHVASVRESFSELQQKNEQLQQAFNRLQELDRLKSNFLATVSHELRTPLTSIIGYSEMLRESIAGELNPEQLEFVNTIHDKGEQLLELIKGLLDLSKLESGTMILHRKQVDADPLLRDVTQTVAPAARKKGVEVELSVPERLPLLSADPERLRQVFLNLVENAVKFTPEGGKVTLSARVSEIAPKTADAGGMVLLGARRSAIEFRVTDTGPGVPLAERERVFDPFYQIDSSSTRQQGGTGLGLSIVQRLVAAHEGRVHIEDNSPRGAVFVVTIPNRRATVS